MVCLREGVGTKGSMIRRERYPHAVWRRARKARDCTNCAALIAVGDTYLDASTFDPSTKHGKTRKFCIPCADADVPDTEVKAVSAFPVGAWIFTNGTDGSNRVYNGADDARRRYVGDMIAAAIKAGVVEQPGPCHVCGATPARPHSEDYYRPWRFVDVCRRCHMNLHTRKRWAAFRAEIMKAGGNIPWLDAVARGENTENRDRRLPGAEKWIEKYSPRRAPTRVRPGKKGTHDQQDSEPAR